MAEYLIQDTTAQGIVNKVKTKAGVTGTLTGSEVEDAIDSILTPTDGTIPTKTSSNLTASGKTVYVPAGYYASQASKSVSTVTQATPSISIGSSGLITASATQSAGYVSSGTKSNTYQLATQAAKTITPTTSSQTAVASGRYTTGAVTVAAVPTQTGYITPSSSGGWYYPDSGNFFNQVYVYGASGAITEELNRYNTQISGNYLTIHTNYNINSLSGFSLTFAYFDTFEDPYVDPMYGNYFYYGSLCNIISTNGYSGNLYLLSAAQQSYENTAYGSDIDISVYSNYIEIYNKRISNWSMADFAGGFITYIPS